MWRAYTQALLPGKLSLPASSKYEWRMYGSVYYSMLHILNQNRTRSKDHIQWYIFENHCVRSVSEYSALSQGRKVSSTNLMVDRVYFQRLNDEKYFDIITSRDVVNNGLDDQRTVRTDRPMFSSSHIMLSSTSPACFRYTRRYKTSAPNYIGHIFVSFCLSARKCGSLRANIFPIFMLVHLPSARILNSHLVSMVYYKGYFRTRIIIWLGYLLFYCGQYSSQSFRLLLLRRGCKKYILNADYGTFPKSSLS